MGHSSSVLARLAWIALNMAIAAQAIAGPPRSQSFQLLEATIDSVHAAFENRQITCRSLVESYIARISGYDRVGPSLTSVQTVNPVALQDADRLDAAFKFSGRLSPLHCVPVLVKDQIEAGGMPTTYGSVVFKDFTSHRDATAVERMKQAGAIILAKSTMGEFAARYAGSAFGLTRNPYDLRRNPGGSSGGTAAGLAANLGLIGLGQDTGGSIRGPAANNSLVGLRPTVPIVSRHGTLPSRPSTDTLGPMARTVRDAAILLDVIAGYDPRDAVTAYSVGNVPGSYAALLDRNGVRGARLGVIRAPMDPSADPASADYLNVKVVIDRAINDLERLGARVVNDLLIPGLDERITRMYHNNRFETELAINAYLAEHSNAPVKSLFEIVSSNKVVPSRERGLRASLGATTRDAGFLDVLLAKEETRQIVLQLMADNRLDAILYASSDHQPTEIVADVLTNPAPTDRYNRGSNRYLASGLGFPAITVPAGFTTDGLPVGLELMGRPFSEGTLLMLAYAFEQGTHHRKAPILAPALPRQP